MSPLLIYVAGPYSAATEHGRLVNTERAMFAGRILLDLGHWPVIPHLSHFFDAYIERLSGQRLDPETYMQWDFAILRRCDALLFLASSPGADRELVIAKKRLMTIYRDLAEVPYA